MLIELRCDFNARTPEMEGSGVHAHCSACVSRRCKTRAAPGIACELLACPASCGAVFHACKSQEHRLLCPQERVPCLNKAYGCPLTLARRSVGSHLRSCPASVVCCTMEWNRWPVRVGENQRRPHETQGATTSGDSTEQLDMALAQRDQRMLLESLKVMTLFPELASKVALVGDSSDDDVSSVASGSSSATPSLFLPPSASVSVSLSDGEAGPAGASVSPGAVGRHAAGAGGGTLEKLYRASVETTRSLAKAYSILERATREMERMGHAAGQPAADEAQAIAGPSGLAPLSLAGKDPPAAGDGVRDSGGSGLGRARIERCGGRGGQRQFGQDERRGVVIAAVSKRRSRGGRRRRWRGWEGAGRYSRTTRRNGGGAGSSVCTGGARWARLRRATFASVPQCGALRGVAQQLRLLRGRGGHGGRGGRSERGGRRVFRRAEFGGLGERGGRGRRGRHNRLHGHGGRDGGVRPDKRGLGRRRHRLHEREIRVAPFGSQRPRRIRARERADAKRRLGRKRRRGQLRFGGGIGGGFLAGRRLQRAARESGEPRAASRSAGVVAPLGGRGLGRAGCPRGLREPAAARGGAAASPGAREETGVARRRRARRRLRQRPRGGRPRRSHRPLGAPPNAPVGGGGDAAAVAAVAAVAAEVVVEQFPPTWERAVFAQWRPRVFSETDGSGVHAAHTGEPRPFRAPDSFRRCYLGDLYRWKRRMQDKAVDTGDLARERRGGDDGGVGEVGPGIDLVTAALLFCLDGESPCGRGVSDRRVSPDGARTDTGTQTFSLPSAVLATRTMVGEMASAPACDHASPQLSNPSPFPRLGLDLVLECVTRYQAKPRSMFTFVCGQLFRRDEFPHHFKNVHGDIHAGLNGWLEQRCPLAHYGCPYTQQRLCPSAPGAKVVHSTRLGSFGVLPFVPPEHRKHGRSAAPSPIASSSDDDDAVRPAPALGDSGGERDRLSRLPLEVLQQVARRLDGYSLCQLSLVSRLLRDVCGGVLPEKGMVTLVWERRRRITASGGGSFTWRVKHKAWCFSTAFSPVSRWAFAEAPSMAEHLRRCRYNAVERRHDAVPLPCMCGPRQRTREGRSLRSVLRPANYPAA
ncbi:F-box only protein 30-like [Lethenteron reissneri]|uniref:F-box only protein 30-like n=1 Tax=Lethenteron reissneri TaxID=7753 RepID=UPI002AB5E821|nr:F-box only protein 30-like [Lethenteron reissneri]